VSGNANARRRLTKRHVETLLGSLTSATDAVDEEIVVVRDALAEALQVVLGDADPDADPDGDPASRWRDLVESAATRGGWPDERRASLRTAADPTRLADPDTVLADLWDLVTELSERRTL
jgi:hypothetical protein